MKEFIHVGQGTYIVETGYEIKNPKADRRSKDWNKAPIIPIGSRFVVRHNKDGYASISSTTGYGFETDRSELGKLIIANSGTADPKSVKELMIVYNCDWSAEEVLRILVKLGRVSKDDFKAVADVPEDY
jgi:hypothetical protein